MIQMRYSESLNSRKGRDSGSWRRGTYMGEDITQLRDGVHSMDYGEGTRRNGGILGLDG